MYQPFQNVFFACLFLYARQRWKKSNKYNATENPEIASSCYWARSFIWSWKLVSLSSGFTSFFLMLTHLGLLILFFWKTSCICNEQDFPPKSKDVYVFSLPLFLLIFSWTAESSWAKTNLLLNQNLTASGIFSLLGFIGSNHL